MYKVGLIGLGDVGFGYSHGQGAKNLTHFSAIISHPNLKLLYGVDPVRPCNWPSSINFFPDIDDIDVVCDIAVIASPTHSHLSVTERICTLKNPPKLLLLEKPAGASLSDLSKISQISVNTKVPIFVNFFRDCLAENISNLLSNKRVTHIHINFTGTLLNTGYHFLHFVQKILGGQIQLSDKSFFGDHSIYFCNIKSVKVIVFENKAASIPENTITFFGEKSKVLYDNENNKIKSFGVIKNKIYASEDIFVVEETKGASLDNGFKFVYEEIINAIEGRPCKLPSIVEVESFRRVFEHDNKQTCY